MELRAIKSFYDDRNGLVTLEDDVLSIVSQVRELYGDRVKICLEPTSGHYVLSEMCADGEERLIFTCENLDGRVITRLQRADGHARGAEDPYDAAEREQDDAQQAIDDYYRGYIGEAGAHLVHALKKEGKAPRMPLTKSMYIPGKAEKEMERNANHNG